MAFSGGVFSLYTPGNPVVTGTVITSTWANNTLSDIATGLSTTVLKDGTQTLTANIPMSGYKLTGLASGTATTNSAAYGQLAEEFISSSNASGGVAYIDFTGLSSTYRQYKVRISNMFPLTGSTTLYVLASTDGGSTFYNNGNYRQSYVYGGATATGTCISTASASGIVVMPGQAIAAEGPICADITIDNPGGTSTGKAFRVAAVGQSPAGSVQSVHGAGLYGGGVSAVNAIRIIFSSGSIGQGVAALYGVKA